MRSAKEKRCSEMVADGGSRWPSFHDCRYMAEVGEEKCKFHLSVERRRKEKHQSWADAAKVEKLNEQSASRYLRALAKEGIAGKIHYEAGPGGALGRYDGRIVVDPKALYDLILEKNDEIRKLKGKRR